MPDSDPNKTDDTLDGVVNGDNPNPAPQTQDNSALMKELGELTANMNFLKDELKSMKDSSSQVSNESPPPELPPLEDITAEQINKALEAGEDVGSLIKKSAQIEAERLRREQMQEMNNIRSIGISTMEELSNNVTSAQMPHVKSGLLAKEYETYLKQLPAEARMHPKVRMEAYYRVVGANEEKVKESMLEEIHRNKTDDGGNDISDPNRSSHNKSQDAPPSVYDVGGPGAVAAMNAIGLSDDENGRNRFAEKMGHKNWGDYVKFAEEAGIWSKTEQ